MAQELAQERVRRKGSVLEQTDATRDAVPVRSARPLSSDQKQEADVPVGYSLQAKSAEEKSKFIKARMGISKEVWLSFPVQRLGVELGMYRREGKKRGEGEGRWSG